MFLGRVVGLLSFALNILAMSSSAIRSLDANDAGIDDEIADKIDEFIDFVAPIIASVPQSGNNPARGYTAILQYGNSVMSALESILVKEPKPEGEDDRVERAQGLLNDLSDPTKVYQAQRGDDAQLLVDFKQMAKEKVGQIIAKVDNGD